MKKHALGLIAGLVCLAGCNENKMVKYDSAYWQEREPSRAVALMEVRTDHVGNLATQAIVGGAVGGAIGGLTLHALDGPVKSEMPYIQRLDQQVLARITQRLASNQQPAFETANPILTGENWGKEADGRLKEALATMPGDRLGVRLRYTHKDSLFNSVAMRGEWRVYDPAGKERLRATTWVFSDEGSGLLPNTRDEKFESQYLALADRSAEQFLRLLAEKRGR
jgi:hypothetical protein